MKKLILAIFIILSGILFLPSNVSALTCASGNTGGTIVLGCKVCGGSCVGNKCTGTYCCQTNQNQSCSCGGADCSCTIGGGGSCSGSGGTATCNCAISGAACSDNSSCGGANATTFYGDACKCTITSGTCSYSGSTTTTLYCAVIPDPTNSVAPNPTNASGPTSSVPTAVPPTAVPPTAVPPTAVPPTAVPPTAVPPVPTPAIVGTIYNDPNNLSVAGASVCSTSDPSPAGVSIPNATIKAVSGATTANASFIGPDYKITSNLVTGNSYTLTLALPTPAATDLNSYICSCPIGGNDYLCQYNVTATSNTTANFFVRSSSLASAWWQTYGASVYAKTAIQTQIPVGTCDAAGSTVCTSALIVGTADSAGFAVLGEGGSLKTTTSGSDAYVQSLNARTTAAGAYAVGVTSGKEDYDFFANNVSTQVTNFQTLAELKSAITAMPSDSIKYFTYTGGGDVVVDKNSASIPLSLTNGKRVVVFVPGSLNFTNTSGSATPKMTDVPVGTLLMFIVKGNIVVDNSVGFTNSTTNPATAQPNLTGVFMANGQIVIKNDGSLATADRKFIGAGTFVGWGGTGSSNGNGIDLQRSFQDASGLVNNSTSPAETFIYRPDFLANFPAGLKTASYNWNEIAPRK